MYKGQVDGSREIYFTATDKDLWKKTDKLSPLVFHMKHTASKIENVGESIFLQVGVKIFLRNEDGKYLLLKRSFERYPNIENFWDIPGGRIIPGTKILDNIVREVFEETGLSVKSSPILLYVQDVLRLPGKHIVRLTFSACTSGNPVLDGEHDAFRWVTLKEMEALKKLDKFTREIIEKKLLSK